MKNIFGLEILIVLGTLLMMVRCSGNEKQKCVGCDEADNQGKCDKRKLKRVDRYMQKLKCEPEPTLVKLHATAPHLSIQPAMVRVNRCSGYCKEGFNTCLPTKTSQAIIPVLLLNRFTNMPKCVEYHVEQHDECACDCEIRKEHCSELQKHEHCSCKCHNDLEKYQCQEAADKIWNEEKCECSCQNEGSCDMGFIWNTKECRCEMMMMSPSDISENFLY